MQQSAAPPAAFLIAGLPILIAGGLMVADVLHLRVVGPGDVLTGRRRSLTLHTVHRLTPSARDPDSPALSLPESWIGTDRRMDRGPSHAGLRRRQHNGFHRRVPRTGGRDRGDRDRHDSETAASMSFLRPVCALSPPAAQRRGLIWVIGAFAICPCHLPVTLGLAAAVLSGTASGAFVAGHPYLAGASLRGLAAPSFRIFSAKRDFPARPVIPQPPVS